MVGKYSNALSADDIDGNYIMSQYRSGNDRWGGAWYFVWNWRLYILAKRFDKESLLVLANGKVKFKPKINILRNKDKDGVLCTGSVFYLASFHKRSIGTGRLISTMCNDKQGSINKST